MGMTMTLNVYKCPWQWTVVNDLDSELFNDPDSDFVHVVQRQDWKLKKNEFHVHFVHFVLKKTKVTDDIALRGGGDLVQVLLWLSFSIFCIELC